VSWPSFDRATPPPPALGAVVTTSRWQLADGTTLAPDLTLPRVGGTDAAPAVMTPCGRVATFAHGTFTTIPPGTAAGPLVLLDPGHGGEDSGAVAPDGTEEAVRALQIATLVRDDLRGIDVVMTRTGNQDRSLQYRVALGDALRAAIAVSIHLNANPDTTSSPVPGVETFGSLADPNGRRAAGVIYEAERAYLDTLTPRVGRWAANVDSGALYRIGSHGDYYFQLRQSHVTWVISESLYITNPPETKLVADPSVRAGIAQAIANGIRAYLSSSAHGSGWKTPVKRPDTSGGTPLCKEPV
jgi:N-acetylmuramoyl-L-alanine amidase